MKLKSIIISILAVTLFTACSSIQSIDKDPLDGTSWELVFYRKSSVIEGSKITAEFSGGEVHGSAGCNSYSGSYEIKGDEITFGPMMSTLMACMDAEGVMEQETMYLAWLQDAQSFELSADQLMIYRPDGEALTFSKLSK